MALVPEALSAFGDIHHVLFGLALVAVVMLCPDDLAGLCIRLFGRQRPAPGPHPATAAQGVRDAA